MPEIRPPPKLTALPGSRWLLPVLVFMLLAAGTVGAWRWQSLTQIEAAEHAGLRDSAAHTAELHDRLKLHAQFLRSLSAFAAANVSQDLKAWRRYTNEIDISRNLNGLLAFAYAPAVASSQRTAFVFGQRQLVDRSNFTIFPPPGDNLAVPVTFVAPDTPTSQQALGFNLLSEAVRREAVDIAIASRDVAMSGRITLLSDEKTRRPGFMLLHAIYQPGMPLGNVEERRRAFSGVVLNAYHTDAFLASLNLGFNSQFAIQIFDEGSNSRSTIAQPPALIFDSAPDLPATANAPIFHHEIDFGGRNWVLHYRPRPTQQDSSGFDAARLILVSGLGGSVLLALLVFYLTTHRERAEHYARRITAELRRSEERIRLATAGTNDGLWDQNLQTGEEYISDRMAEIFGFPRDQPPQQLSRYTECIYPEDIERHNAALRRHLRENAPFDIELRIDKTNGDSAWIRARGEAIRDPAGRAIRIAGSVSDITEKKNAEARLERLRRLLATSIAATPLPLFVQDERRKLQMVNDAFCTLLGTPERDLLTRFWPDFAGISAADQRRLLGASERALASGASEPLSFEFDSPDQTHHRLIARIAQAQNPEGEPFLITTLTDVTELHRAETAIKAADRMKQAVLDAATEVAIIACDPEGLITIFNRGAEKMLGYSAHEMVGRQTPQLIHLPTEVAARTSALSRELGYPVSGFETFVVKARNGKPDQREWTYVRKDGRQLSVNLVVTTQRDSAGRVSGYLGIAVDVSEQKRAEQELAQHRDHLQELVAERTQQLDVALHEAQAANVAKSEFLANMSHELRTPMHAILSFAELGEDRAEAGSQTKIAQYFNRIGQSARRLLGLINELLDLAKLEAGRMALNAAPIDVLALLRHTGAHLESLMQTRQLSLEISYDTLQTDLVGDPERIAQVFHNLLSNAIKFSPEKGCIQIHLAAAELPCGRPGENGKNRPALAISFSDAGIGIPQDELHSIFDKFVQSSATKTGAGGTGLGLAISREIVLKHRGTIAAENNTGSGACFTVTLPLNIRMESSDHDE